MKSITIQSIELVNFMCHDNLKINFDKMITCIGGRNGSGKSAVMVALGILFGQRAQSLERGNSYASLIKTGTNQAIIKVTINNYLKYKPEKYGDNVIIEKKLRAKCTKVSMFNSHGKIFNIGKNELENIIEKYGLKFDNPLNFLTQEKSKRFLNVAKPEDLYEFYYLGTEFKNIEEELQESMNILEEMKKKIDETAEKQENIETRLLIQRKNLSFLDFDADAALKRLEIEEKWANIKDSRAEVEQLTKVIEDIDRQIFEKEEERKRLCGILQETVQEESVKELDEELSKLKMQTHDVSTELAEYITERNRAAEQLEKIRNKSNIGKLEKELIECESRLLENRSQLCSLENQREDALKAYNSEKKRNEENEQHSFNLKKQLNYLKQNAFDSTKQAHLESFKKIGEELKNISFKDVVIGPVCRYVKLKEYKWFKTVSIILKKSLMNYIVFNSEDKIKLHSLFKRLNVDYSVSQMFSKKPYQNLRTNPKYKTLLDVLQIDDQLVSNQLITINNIEQIILIEDRENAHSVIRTDPRDVDCAYTLTGDKIKLYNGSLSDFRAKDDGVYWFENKESKIKKLEYDLSRITITEEAKIRYTKLMNDLGRLASEIDNVEKKAQTLKIELESLKGLKENDTGGLEKKYNVALRSIASLENRKKNIDIKITSTEASKQQILDRNRERVNDLHTKREHASSKICKLDYEIVVSENTKSVTIANKKAIQDRVAKSVAELGDEPDNIKSMAKIVKERKGIREFKLRANEMAPKDEIERDIVKMTKEAEYLNKLREKFEGIIQETTEACNKRRRRRDEIKEKDTEDALRMFREYTMKSGYVGEMVIDHENKRLDLKMKVHNSFIAGSKSTLSGGERSFAGLCFLLSMWKCFKCPVKVLDEFDVFMDSLNRKMAIRCLLEFFRETQTQVILITPLDTADLNGSDCDIKLLKKAVEG